MIALSLLMFGCSVESTGPADARTAAVPHARLDRSAQPEIARPLVGRVVEGKYETPLGKLQVSIPTVMDAATLTVQDIYREGLFGLVIADRHGRMYRVDGQRLSRDQQRMLADVPRVEQQRLLSQAAIQPYLAFAPGTQVVEQRLVAGEDELDGAVLLLLSVPGGAPTRADAPATPSQRALIVFRYVHGVYSASTIELPGETLDQLAQRAESFAHGVQFAHVADRASDHAVKATTDNEAAR